MFESLGKFVSRYWLGVILAWLGIAAVLHFTAPRWDDVAYDGDLAYLPGSCESVQGERMLSSAFPNDRSKSQLVFIASRTDAPLSGEDLRVLSNLADRVDPEKNDSLPEAEKLPIVEIWTPDTDIIGKQLVSENGRSGLVVGQVSNEFMALSNMKLLEKGRAAIAAEQAAPTYPKGLDLGISGSAAIGGDILASASESISRTETATIVLVVIILLAVYRAPLLMIVPLATIGLSVFVATHLVAALTQVNHIPGFEWWGLKIFTTTRIFVVVILFGAGTDFCLFLISRYKEELERGLNKSTAAAESLGMVGHALVGSAMTTIGGLSMMYFADYGKFRNSGPVIAICLTIALLACLTFAPAMLRAFGAVVFWPFGKDLMRAARRADAGGDGRSFHRQTAGMTGGEPAVEHLSGFWEWMSRKVIAHPGLILVGSVLVLMPLAYAGLSLEDISYDLVSELSADRPSVIGTKMLQRDFPPGETGPTAVLAYHEKGGLDTDEGKWKMIAPLSKELLNLTVETGQGGVQPVEKVRSWTQPLGKPVRRSLGGILGGRGGDAAAADSEESARKYLADAPEYKGKLARFDVVLTDDPFSPEAMMSLDGVEKYLTGLAQDPNSPWYKDKFYYVGVTAGIRDLRDVVNSDQVLIQRLVVIVVLGVLIALLRRPLVCVYLIVSVLFSYYVTVGATELVFAWWYADAFPGLDWKVPLYLFVILIAVGEDYNIYLATRVFEEQRRHGLREGLRRAMVKTGGIITSCGVIMAGTFLSMMTGTMRGMLELGFALSVGVLLDTLIVRPILVPAFLAVMQNLNEKLRGGTPPRPHMRRDAPVETVGR